jgi:hypothetical protein
VRPEWTASETADLLFDPGFTEVTVQTDARAGVWEVAHGQVVVPMKRLADGAVLRDKYRLRAETGGKGTFSVFHDAHTLRAAKLAVPTGADVTSWCLSADRTLLAASSRRKVYVWKLTYPAAK